MDLKLSTCFITVDGQEKALAFYTGPLGLRVVNDVAFDGMRWITVSPPAQPGLEIGIFTPNENPDASDADREAASALLAKGLLSGLIFHTADCDATFEEIRASGADVLQ